MRLNVTTVGEALLAEYLVKGTKLAIDSFKIATNSGFVPTPAMVTPQGPVTYTGEPNQIKYIRISDNEVSFIIDLEHTLGDFAIGNVIVYLKHPVAGQPPVAFLFGAIPVQAQKYDSDFSVFVVGNKVFIHATVWFPYLTDVIDLGGHTQMYARLTNYRTEEQLPHPDIAEYEQHTLDSHSLYDGVVLTVKENLHSLHWGMQFTQYIDDPALGDIRGGVIPDPHGSPSDVIYYDGRFYKFNNSGYTEIDGGDSWSPPNEEPVDGGAYASA